MLAWVHVHPVKSHPGHDIAVCIEDILSVRTAVVWERSLDGTNTLDYSRHEFQASFGWYATFPFFVWYTTFRPSDHVDCFFAGATSTVSAATLK
jgi:hypothetical protein